jgi:hypothetical protein
MATPKKKKVRQVKVNLTEAVETMVIDVDLNKDINVTQQQVSASTIDVRGIIAINEDEEDEDEAAGEEDADSTEAVAKGLPEAILNKEAETSLQLEDPPSILKTTKKKSMLEVVTGGTTEGINPFFTPGSSCNKEGILLEDFKNIIYLEPMIMVPPKPRDFLSTALKWALLQFTEWFKQAHEDLGETVTLVLFSYIRSSLLEPEAIQDVKKHLKGTANTINKHIFNFCPYNQASSKGKDYQLYTKIQAGTNIFGKDFQQMIDNLKGVSSKVLVFKSVLQCMNTGSHMANSMGGSKVYCSEGQYLQKHINKNMFLDCNVLQVSFQWHLIYDGHTKMDHEKAGVELLYTVYIVVEKKDCTLV